MYFIINYEKVNSNLIIDASNLIIDASNLMIDASNLIIDASNLINFTFLNVYVSYTERLPEVIHNLTKKHK